MRGTDRERWRTVLLAGTALTLAHAAPSWAQSATARPQGGTVVAGQASIAQSAARTTVTQSSNRAIVEWKGFDVGASHTVTFAQPNSRAVVLNRVTGPDPSAIAGRISANGQVVIINRSGVVFSQGAQVDASGLVVSTANIANSDFMAGKMAFTQPGKPGARIENHGRITVRDAGIAALVAPQVANSGTIQAKMGRVVLAGAETHTLDLYGDGLVSLDVSSQVRHTPDGGTALVTNTGTVEAQGGTVLLTAAAAEGVVSTLVRAGGHVSADNPTGTAGTVTLRGTGGEVRVVGTVSATGARGGQVTAVADRVTLASGSRLDVSGRAAGGRADIGETRPGAAQAATARNVRIERGATVTADATEAGKGGEVRVMADDSTVHAGAITARGGPGGGDGGFVEVSSRGGMGWNGTVDVSAAAGAAGNILLDPENIDIVAGDAGSSADDALVGANGTEPESYTLPEDATGSSATVRITTGLLNSLTGNVTLEATNKITVAAAITRASGALTLKAGGTVTVNAAVSSAGGVTINAGTIAINAGVSANAGAVALTAKAGPITLAAGITARDSVTINAGTGIIGQTAGMITGGNVTLSGQSVTLAGNLQTGGMLSVNVSGAITQTGGAVHAGVLSGTASGNVTLLSGSNDIDAVTDFGSGGEFRLNGGNQAVKVTGLGTRSVISLSAGSLTLGTLSASSSISLHAGTVSASSIAAPSVEIGSYTANGALTFASGTISSGNVTIGRAGSVTAGNVAINAALNVAGTLTLAGSGTVSQNARITATTLNATGGNFSLTESSNSINSLGNVGASGTFSLTTAGALSIAGHVSATSVKLDAGGAITTASGGHITASQLSGSAAGANFGTANAVDALGSFNAGTGTLTFGNNTRGLALQGTIQAGNVTLSAAGAISQPSGMIDATRVDLTAPSVSLTGNNQISQVGEYSSSGAFDVNSIINLTTAGDITAATVRLTTSGWLTIAHDVTANDSVGLGMKMLAITGHVTAPVVGLASRTPGSLVVGSDAAAALQIDATALENISTSTLRLGATTADPDDITATSIRFENAAALSSVASLDLRTKGDVTNDLGSVLTADRVTGSVGGSLTLSSAQIRQLGDLSVDGNLSITNQTSLDLAGTITVRGTTRFALPTLLTDLTQSAGTLSTPELQVQGSTFFGGTIALGSAGNAIGSVTDLSTSGAVHLSTSGPMALTGNVRGGTVRLDAGGAITQDSSASITATRLEGSAVGGMSLLGANDIISLGDIDAGGAFRLNATGSVAVAGHVDAGNAIAAFTLNGGALTTSGGRLTAGRLDGSVGSLSLTAADNQIGGIGDLAVSAGAATLRTASDLDVSGHLDATDHVLTLDVTGDLTRTGTGRISAERLDGSAASADLTGTANAITEIGNFTATDDFALATTTGLDLTGSLIADTVRLDAGGAITQDTAATITTARLDGSAASADLTRTANAIGAVGNFTAAGDFALTTTTGLDLTGSLTAGTTRLDASGVITQDSTASITTTRLDGRAASVDLTGTANAIEAVGNFTAAGDFTLATTTGLGLTGDLTADTARLDAGGAITQDSSASITATRLEGSAVGGMSLLGANDIISLGDIDAGGAFRLNATGSVAVAGHVDAGNAVATFTLGGALTTTGGKLTAGRLDGNVGSLSLTAADNQIGGIGDLAVSAGAATLRTASDLDVSGHLDATGHVLTLDVTGDLTRTGTGRISAARLDGSAASADLTGTANAITEVGNFTATDNFALATTTGLDLTGSLIADTVRLDAGGAITQDTAATIAARTLEAIAGGAVSLTGGNQVDDLIGLQAGGDAALTNTVALRIDGPVELGGHGFTVDIDGALTQTDAGPITAARLDGSAASIALDNSDNAIGAAGDFTATGDFTLVTTTGLGLTGDLTADTTRLDAGGAITQDSDAAITTRTLDVAAGGAAGLLGPNRIDSLIGLLASGDVTVVNAASLRFAGPISLGGHTLAIDIGGTLTQTDGAVTADRLTGRATGAISLTNAGNEILRLGDLTAGGPLSFATATSLRLDGAILADGTTVSLSAGGAITQDTTGIAARTLNISADNGFALTGENAIDVLGDADSGGGDAFIRTTGPLTLAGHLDAGAGTFGFDIDGALATAGGHITAGRVTGTAGAITLDAPANRIDRIGAISADGDVTIATQDGAILDGTLDATGHAVRLRTGGGITQASGRIIAAALQLHAPGDVTLAGANAVTALGDSTLGGDVTLANAGSLILAGHVNAAGQAVRLDIAGALTTAGGRLSARSLTGRFAGLSLTGDNAIEAIGDIAAGGDATLRTTGPLRLTGHLDAAGHIVTLSTTRGGIAAAASGRISADTLLTPDAGTSGTVTLAGDNLVARLGPFRVNGGDLVFASNASQLLIPAGAHVHADGSVSLIATLGAPRIDGTVSAGQTLSLSAPFGLAEIRGNSLIADAGDVVVEALSIDSSGNVTAGRDVLYTADQSIIVGGAVSAGERILLTAPSITLAGLEAADTDVYLQMFGGEVNGSVASGRLVLVGVGGIGSMTGSVGGITGQAAATRVERETIDGTPLPATPDDRKLLMNGCPVRTINCSVIPGASAIPPGSPLRDVVIMMGRPDEDDDDVQLPGVAARDY